MNESHDDHGHSGHEVHHAPSSFLRRYVFSTDHKVIGIQFMFSSLFFVVIGGLLALGVRYQLAWPQQDVPFTALLPGTMTNTAPEANLALWKPGHELTLKTDISLDGRTLPRGTSARFVGFADNQLPITLPAGTLVAEKNGGGERELSVPREAVIEPAHAQADYSYVAQQVRVNRGVTVHLQLDDGATIERVITGRTVLRPDGVIDTLRGQVVLPVRTDAAHVWVDVPQQTLGNGVDGVQPTSVAAGQGLALPATALDYQKNALTTDAYLTLFTMHASVMIFLVIIPMLVGAFGNFLVPLMIGARDMAFPKLNALSFWIAMPAALMLVVSFWVDGGAAGGGWTMYPTLSEAQHFVGAGTTLWVLAVGLIGFSSVVGALNYITTTINMRAPGMTLFRMPLTVWSILITATLALFATPMLTAAMVLLSMDRLLGTTFFLPDGGGQPLLWQHLFWFYSHPAVYIMILPGMGLVSDVLAVHARKPIFGYKPMVFAMMAISGLGFIVWGHHMFQSGMNPTLGTTFMAATIMIAVPSAIKTFNWLGTLWGGNIHFTPAMLNALGFVSMFVIGGLSGIFMASAPIDIPLHDTYFIVAHIHYVLFGGSIFAIFAGIYHWFPKMFGRQMNQRWGVIHFIMSIIAFNGTFFLMHILGLGGHPRRYASILEYPTLEHLQPLNVFMTISAMMLGMAQLPFLYNFFVSLPRKLGRAITVVFVCLGGLPMALGKLYHSDWAQPLRTAHNIFQAEFWSGDDPVKFVKIWGVMLAAGLAYAVAATVAVFAIWTIGGKLRLPALCQRLLWIVFLPAFLMPLLLKPDAYLWLGMTSGYQWRWVLLALTAVPGLLFLLAARPRDRFGYPVDDNPWHANSIEWATTSPPPHDNFAKIPHVYRGPYEFNSPVAEEDYLPQPRALPDGVVEPTH